MSIFLALAEILFIGDGRLEGDVSLLVEAGLNQMGGSVSVAIDTIPGAPLQYNLDEPSTEDKNGSPRRVEAITELGRGDTRAMILVETVPLSKVLPWHEPANSVATYAAIARATNPDVRVFYTETWHSLQSGITVNLAEDAGSDVPWRERINLDRDIWRAVASKASDDALGGPIEVIPVGQAMGRLSDEIEASKIPGIADISELFRSDVEPTGRGAYFVAMVYLSVLTGQSPEGLPARLLRNWPTRDWVISDEQAAIFQRIAWEEAQAFAALPPLEITEPVVLAAPDAPAEVAAAEPPPAPVPDVIDLPGVTNPNLFVGLAGISDWSTQAPFLDLMKTARPWFGHLPDQWGAIAFEDVEAAGILDGNGWPMRLPEGVTGLSTVILTDMPADTLGVRGRYVVRYQGQGRLKIELAGRQVSDEPGQLMFDYEPGAGLVMVTIETTDPTDPIRDITIVREDRVAAFDAGEMFNPDWLARLSGVKGLRFMDWMATNNSTQTRFDQRPLPTDFTWAAKGVPLEVMLALVNTLDADPWFTLPHLADDDYVTRFAQMVSEGLKPDRKVWLEYSNEVWNFQFQQANWAEEQGKRRWGEEYAWVQFYALRASEVAAIWTDVFGDKADARLVRVIGTHPGWLGLEPQILTAPLVMGEGRPAPAASFDAYAITGYFSGNLGQEAKIPVVRGWIAESVAAAERAAAEQGLEGDAAAAHVATHRFDAALAKAAAELRDGQLTDDPEDSLGMNIDEGFRYQAQVAKEHDLKLVMYEGGTHVVGLGEALDDPLLTEFFMALNYSAEMGVLYDDLLKAWSQVTDAPFTHYFDVGQPSKWGSWGAMRHLGDSNPRWNALATGCGAC